MWKTFAAALALTVTASGAVGCEVDGISYSKRGSHTYVTGATTCAAGRMDYRIYQGEEFLTSGFTYFQGYAFQFYAPGGLPDTLTVRYEIQPQG